jgi:uncharacterized protein
MAALPDHLRKTLLGYVAAVNRDVPVLAVYVFGSQARGTAGPDSDVDLAVVSKAFRGMRRVDAGALLIARTEGLGLDIQPVGLTPEDLADESDPIAQAVRTDGVELSLA